MVSKDGSKFWSSQTWWHFLTLAKHFDGELVSTPIQIFYAVNFTYRYHMASSCLMEVHNCPYGSHGQKWISLQFFLANLNRRGFAKPLTSSSHVFTNSKSTNSESIFFHEICCLFRPPLVCESKLSKKCRYIFDITAQAHCLGKFYSVQ